MPPRLLLALTALAAPFAVTYGAQALAAETAVNAPVAKLRLPAAGHTETAIFAGGCFWGVEAVFEHVKGVKGVVSGYAGGTAATANYDQVSGGDTRHAEAVRVTYDPMVVNYADLLRIYFSVVADPTLLNRQGPDHGPQYRSALFPQSPGQAKVARAYIAQLTAGRTFQRPIVTRIEGAGPFFAAEAYHQDFMTRNPSHPYILAHDRPKVAALKAMYPGVWRG